MVELFLLNSTTKEYLELEFGPHQHYLALKFKDARNGIDTDVKLTFAYEAQIEGDNWTGVAQVPIEYVPKGVDQFNAYG